MKKNITTRQSETDWERIRNMKDEDIDFSDIPRMTPDFFINGIVRKGLKPVIRKKQLTLRIDSDIIDYLKASGNGYQTKINQLLRSFVDAEKESLAKYDLR